MLFELLETFSRLQDHLYLYLDAASLQAAEQWQINQKIIINDKAAYQSPPKTTKGGLFFLLTVMIMNKFYSFTSTHMKILFCPPTIETSVLYHSFFKISEKKKIHISI